VERGIKRKAGRVEGWKAERVEGEKGRRGRREGKAGREWRKFRRLRICLLNSWFS
jgi:hypothetical protein